MGHGMGEIQEKRAALVLADELQRLFGIRGGQFRKIGIQLDQEYKGNVYQPGEYAGFDAQ